jgi:hypothetical protein
MEWLEVLRREVAGSSQAAVARDLQVSETTISLVLAGRYGAKTTAIERLVRGRYLGAKVQCPAAGFDLPANLCVVYQRVPFAPGNPSRVRFQLACPSCPNYLKGPQSQ